MCAAPMFCVKAIHLGKWTITVDFFPLTLFHSKFLYQGNVINVWSPLKQLTCINLVDSVEIHKTQGDF